VTQDADNEALGNTGTGQYHNGGPQLPH
jgi:hypothetical protein